MIYSIPLEKLIEHEIMKDKLLRGEENARHFHIEDGDEEELDRGAKLGNVAEVCQFIKLLQTIV